MQDIHDIRPPILVGIDPLLIKWLLSGLGVLLLLLLVFVLIRKWLKNRPLDRQSKLLPKPLPPYEQAMQSLDRLSTKPIDQPRIFYFDLTLILRKYMGRSFNTQAVEMTSQQFLESIRKSALDERIKMQVIEFYKACDPYKYAGAVVDAGQVQMDLAKVRQIVIQVDNFQKPNESGDIEGAVDGSDEIGTGGLI